MYLPSNHLFLYLSTYTYIHTYIYIYIYIYIYTYIKLTSYTMGYQDGTQYINSVEVHPQVSHLVASV
jgi:hypothetical protein